LFHHVWCVDSRLFSNFFFFGNVFYKLGTSCHLLLRIILPTLFLTFSLTVIKNFMSNSLEANSFVSMAHFALLSFSLYPHVLFYRLLWSSDTANVKNIGHSYIFYIANKLNQFMNKFRKSLKWEAKLMFI